ncbi:MAG: methyltransferase domain-containing protein [Planctomycetota bacterium]
MNFDSRHFNSPLSLETADHLLALLDPTPERTLLDIGCGRGELIARWHAAGGGAAIGVDPHEGEIALARMRDLQGAGRVDWHLGRMGEVDLPAGHDCVACIGASHALVDEKSIDRLRDALIALRKLVKPGGTALLGEGFWKQPPPAEYLAATGMKADEMLSHAENLELCEEVGSAPYVLASSPWPSHHVRAPGGPRHSSWKA